MPKKKQKPHKQGTKEVSTKPIDGSSYEMLSLDLIDDPAAPMRSELTEASVQELAMSIKQVGLIEPIIVKAVNGRYEVIAGHRRTLACRLAKLPIVPCHIRVANDEQTEMLKIHENMYRQDIKPADEAKHFDYLITKQKLTPPKIAQLINKSPAYVNDRLNILSYPDFLEEAMNAGHISFSVAKEFSRFDDDKQMRQAVFYAKRGGMTQEMARKWVQDHKRSREVAPVVEHVHNANNGEPEEVIYTSKCIYCRLALNILQAQTVYIHDDCLHTANAVVIKAENEPPPAAAENLLET